MCKNRERFPDGRGWSIMREKPMASARLGLALSRGRYAIWVEIGAVVW